MTAPRVRTLKVSARHFYEFIDRVLPYASTDDTLPVLNSVRLETRNGWLVATTTDRFRAGMVRAERAFGVKTAAKTVASTTKVFEPGPLWPQNFHEILPTAAYRVLNRIIRPIRGLDAELELVFSDGKVTVSATGAMLHLDDIVMTLDGFPDVSEFPAVRKLVVKAIAADATETTFGVNAQFVGDFAKSIGRNETLAVKTGAGMSNPLLVTGADANFIGILMPRRALDDAGRFPDLSSWTELLTEDVE